MFTYSQSTGEMEHDGEPFIPPGYSGNGLGYNNPDMQGAHNVGPIPRGLYTIQPPHQDAKVGPVAMALVPDSANNMFGRADFLIHGDNHAMNHSASHGCIILPLTIRRQIGARVLDGDDQLTVTT